MRAFERVQLLGNGHSMQLAMIPVVFALWTLTAPPFGQEPFALVEGSTHTFTLAAAAEGSDPRSPDQVLRWTATRVSTPWIWCRGKTADARLSIERSSRPGRTEDEDSGGGQTAFVHFEVAAGESLTIHAGGGAGEFELHLSTTYEDERTSALDQRVSAELKQVKLDAARGQLADHRDWLKQTTEELLALERTSSSWSVSEDLWQTAQSLNDLGEYALARHAFEYVRAARERVMPEECIHVQRARLKLAVVLQNEGDLAGSIQLKEAAILVLERTRPAYDNDLLIARANLGAAFGAQGDWRRAIALYRAILAVDEKHVPAGHPLRSNARLNLGEMLRRIGDFAAAREMMQRALADTERDRPTDPSLPYLRLNFARVLSQLGEHAAAKAMVERGLTGLRASLPEDSLELIGADVALVEVLREAGELAQARSIAENMIARLAERVPPEHPTLLQAYQSLAPVLLAQGELLASRDLLERTLAMLTLSRPPGADDLEGVRLNLSTVLGELGDAQRSRAMLEDAIEGLATSLPPTHPTLLLARLNLAEDLRWQGEAAHALEIQRSVVATLESTPESGGVYLSQARINMAASLLALGSSEEAEALSRSTLADLERSVSTHDKFLRLARSNLAFILQRRGDVAGAEPLMKALILEHEAVSTKIDLERLEEYSQLATIQMELGDAPGLSANAAKIIAGACELERTSRTGLSVREAGALANALRRSLQTLVTCTRTLPLPELDPALVELDQDLRGLGMQSAANLRESLRDPALHDDTWRLRALGERVAALAGKHDAGPELTRTLNERSELERKLQGRRAAAALSTPAVHELARVRAALTPDSAAVVLMTSRESPRPSPGQVLGPRYESLVAFVLRKEGPLVRTELGPWAPIEQGIERWREALAPGASTLAAELPRGKNADERTAPLASERSAGLALRALVFDPLRPALEKVKHLIVALDGDLQLVPLDALPDGDADGTRVLGDTLAIELRDSLWELLEPASDRGGAGTLVALGGVDYATSESEPSTELFAAVRLTARGERFAPLPATHVEVQQIAELWPGAHEQVILLEGARATKAVLAAVAPSARCLHLATHGWAAKAELARSQDDAHLRDTLLSLSPEQRQKQRAGLSPLSLCGLALAGIDLDHDLGTEAAQDNRARGALSAEELSTWDLSQCELVVLSACESGLGVRMPGQGLAGLPYAVRCAGARVVVSSLWPVPDRATAELMRGFYRRLWVDKLAPRRALWEAKRALREARDARGERLYQPGDWAGWIIAGAAD